MKLSSLKMLGQAAVLASMTFAGTAAFAGASTAPAPVESEGSALAAWWNGKYATGNWFGLRQTLLDHGLKLGGKWTGVFYGIADGGISGVRGSFFDEEIAFNGELNFGKLLNVAPLEALTAFSEVRWRDGLNPNLRAGASSNFQVSHFQSGKQWRLMTFGVTYAPDMFGIKKFLTLTGGWIRPQKEFIDQPLSKLFVNNTFESSKGIGANIPFSSSFSTWGGTLKISPTKWYYAKGGLFMSFPQSTSTANHGLAFEGYGPDPEQNGLFVMGETGVTPTIGASKLPGRYAIGGYYYETESTSYYGQEYNGVYGFYAQADQMLFREASPELPEPMAKGPSDGKSITPVGDGKSFKEPVPVSQPELSEQGLYMFSLFTYAPKYNNILPFYFHTGLVYKGLIPTRDADQTMVAFGLGQYSYYNIENLQNNGKTNQPNFTAVLEFDYRFQVNNWSYVQPYLQYLIQPNGTGAIENDTVLGFMAGITF